MNAFIILLDPFLHTVNYVRNNSTVLFTSILAVSAKFLRPDLYPMLISSARHLTGRAIIDGKVSLGLIQSILLQVYWKEPEDRTAWLRIGEAIRMGALNTHESDGASMTRGADRPWSSAGFQLHLHDYRTTPLPDDETEARQTMDRERTWIDLCVRHILAKVSPLIADELGTFRRPSTRLSSCKGAPRMTHITRRVRSLDLSPEVKLTTPAIVDMHDPVFSVRLSRCNRPMLS